MTSTPQSVRSLRESLNDSWFEVSINNSQTSSHVLDTPVHCLPGPISQSLEKLLIEAQSYNSSAVGSYDCVSPMSPHSPMYQDDLALIDNSLINKVKLMERNRLLGSDWIWDWTVCDEPYDYEKELALDEDDDKKSRLNLRQWAVRRGLFSKEVLSLLLLTNILSLIVGAGISYSVTIKRSL